jgi:hypothetical protein
MAFEAVTRRMPTLNSMGEVFDCALGVRPYPWELPPAEQPCEWRASRLRALVEPCFARDPAQRPSSAALLATVERVGQATSL